jgi:DNA polymerase III subunit epsilon
MKVFRRRSSMIPALLAYENADLPRGRTPWREANYSVVDLELSGLNPRIDEILSYGVVPVEHGLVVAGATTYGLVRPGRPVPERSVLIHGIRTVDLATARPIEEAIVPLLMAITGRVLVAHAADVERSFIGAALRRLGGRLRKPVIDTQWLGRLWLSLVGEPSSGWLSLGDLVTALELPEHRPHHALGDALTTAQAFIALSAHLDARHPETVKSLSQAADRLKQARLVR